MPARVPQQDRSTASTERMLDAAEELLTEQGAEALTVEAVISLAQTSMGSFYARFESRQGLIDALHRRFLNTVPPRIIRAIDTQAPKENLYEELKDLGFELFTVMEANRRPLSFFISQAVPHGELHEVAHQVHLTLIGICTRRIKSHKSELTTTDLASKIDFAGRLYYGVALQNILWESDFVTGQKKSIKKLSVELAEFVYNSLRK
jgi:AcrR family transcriptional regulator